MTYPEFKDRLLEDIPYEEYTAAMNGFVKYVVSLCFITRLIPVGVAGLGFEGKNTHERSSATRQHDLLHNLDVKKG